MLFSDYELIANADDSAHVFADGSHIGHLAHWQAVETFRVPVDTTILAFVVYNGASLGGVMGNLSNGVVTDGSWKCTGQQPENDGMSSFYYLNKRKLREKITIVPDPKAFIHFLQSYCESFCQQEKSIKNIMSPFQKFSNIKRH